MNTKEKASRKESALVSHIVRDSRSRRSETWEWSMISRRSQFNWSSTRNMVKLWHIPRKCLIPLRGLLSLLVVNTPPISPTWCRPFYSSLCSTISLANTPWFTPTWTRRKSRTPGTTASYLDNTSLFLDATTFTVVLDSVPPEISCRWHVSQTPASSKTLNG
jgi:hypothetical protein